MTLPDWTPEEILKWLGYSGKECQCPARKALEKIKPYVTHRESSITEVCYDWCPLCHIDAVLSAPCPCEMAIVQRDQQYQRAQSLQEALLTEMVRAESAKAECEILRAQLQRGSSRYSPDPPTVTCERCGAVSSYFLKTYPTERRRYCPGCKNTLTQHPRAKKP